MISRLPKPTEVTKDTALIGENSALRDEVRQLRKENLDLSESILFSRNASRNRSRSRSRERRGKRKDRAHPDSDFVFSNADESDFSSYDDCASEEEESYVEGDPYFQETINKLLKENILLKRSHKAYEKCFKELEEECEGHKKTIQEQKDKLEQEESKRNTLEKEFEEHKKAHIALEQAHIELDYGMKKMLEDNVDMRKDLNFLHAAKEEDRMKAKEAAAAAAAAAKKKRQTSILKTPRTPDFSSGTTRSTPPPRPEPPKVRPQSAHIERVDDIQPASDCSKAKPTTEPRPKPKLKTVVKVKKVSGFKIIF